MLPITHCLWSPTRLLRWPVAGVGRHLPAPPAWRELLSPRRSVVHKQFVGGGRELLGQAGVFRPNVRRRGRWTAALLEALLSVTSGGFLSPPDTSRFVWTRPDPLGPGAELTRLSLSSEEPRLLSAERARTRAGPGMRSGAGRPVPAWTVCAPPQTHTRVRISPRLRA